MTSGIRQWRVMLQTNKRTDGWGGFVDGDGRDAHVW